MESVIVCNLGVYLGNAQPCSYFTLACAAYVTEYIVISYLT